MSNTEAKQEKKAATTTPVEKVDITITSVLKDLSEGLDRKQIGKKYSLSPIDTKRLFSHPKLKGMKTRPQPKFNLLDDAPERVSKAKLAEDEIPSGTSEAKTENLTAKEMKATEGDSQASW